MLKAHHHRLKNQANACSVTSFRKLHSALSQAIAFYEKNFTSRKNRAKPAFCE
jgi:hypothetical protein